MKKFSLVAAALVTLIAQALASPALAQHLQCVPYARTQSGISIHGNAATWWAQAEGTYSRGHVPQTGSVLVFKSTAAMPYGHVAMIREIVDSRHVLLDHANWSGPGLIERRALAEDISEAGDWSSVRVWYGPSRALGSRENPTFGFIYNGVAPITQFATVDSVDASKSAG
ncbi:CHAP domain-containing protein [Novosphingobium sp. ZW T3_23]|uniref:CHAP domain-containing protein n=1 Tax=Novosphingobium sp. ZW T3_23 TaxID=3378084 RepID=UPI00385528E1